MINLIILMVCAVIFAGIIVKVKAKIAARQMPLLWQPFFDGIVFLEKGRFTVLSPVWFFVWRP